jgi:hypothetical protein
MLITNVYRAGLRGEPMGQLLEAPTKKGRENITVINGKYGFEQIFKEYWFEWEPTHVSLVLSVSCGWLVVHFTMLFQKADYIASMIGR